MVILSCLGPHRGGGVWDLTVLGGQGQADPLKDISEGRVDLPEAILEGQEPTPHMMGTLEDLA